MLGSPERPPLAERWELEAYLHGDADEAAAHRIQQDPTLSAEVKLLQAEHQQLHSVLDRLDCPSPDQLRDLAWKALSQGEKNRIERHLLECESCAAEFAQLAGSSRYVTPPGLFQSLEQGIRVWVAQLVPSGVMPASVLRGEGDVALTYQIPDTDWEVSLETQQVAQGYALTGQLFGPSTHDLSNSRASLLNNDLLLQEVDVEVTGWFSFSWVTPGAFKIWVESPTFRIQLPLIELGLG